MLHIVCSPGGLDSCEKSARREDSVVFTGDAAYCAKRTTCNATYVIGEDLEGRGVAAPTGVTCITFDEFVDLVVQTPSSVTWS